MYKAILFDLDGTLTESGEGITKSVQYALEKLGRPEPDLSRLLFFVGPPLVDSFMKLGLSEEQAHEGVKYYRERYATNGLFENKPYPGVENMLKELKARGYILAVASSKPEHFVCQVLEYFHLEGYFKKIVGSTMDGSMIKKKDVIEETLRRLHMSDKREQVIMVGDKEHDVLGARQAGLNCIAVSYGYGSEEELTNAAPLKIVESTDELLDFFS